MYNKAILMGRLTAEPELKYTQSGTAVVSFRLAADRPYKDQSGQRQADFISIQAWRQTAELVCSHFHKGDPILVEGSIQTRSYEDRQGQNRTITEVVADRIGFLPGKPQRQEPTAPEPEDFQEVQEDDLPFDPWEGRR